MVDPSWVRNGLVNPRSNLVNLRSNLVNPGQTWSSFLELREMCSGVCPEIIPMWWTLVGSNWLGPDCPVLGADTRENPGGKNGVMTLTCLLSV